MRKITDLKELQKIELNMLIEIDRLCRKHNLSFYLAGGTLLGAIRHKGFIPWDDDIDISMPRADYEKFIQIMENSGHNYYRILTLKNRRNYFYPFAKVVDTRTMVKELNTKEIEGLGVSIDIFPIDGMGNEYKKALKRVMKVMRLRSRIWEANLKKRDGSFLRQTVKTFMNAVIRIVGVERAYDMLIKYVNQYKFEDSVWVASAVGGANMDRELIQGELFRKTCQVEFEGLNFPAPVGYEKYLTNLYGDYMKLPPVEKRVPVHENEIWWK